MYLQNIFTVNVTFFRFEQGKHNVLRCGVVCCMEMWLLSLNIPLSLTLSLFFFLSLSHSFFFHRARAWCPLTSMAFVNKYFVN